MKNGKISLISRIIFHVTLVIFAIMSIGGPMLLANADVINSTLGIETEKGSGLSSNMYYDTQFKTMAEVKAASLKTIEETMSEGSFKERQLRAPACQKRHRQYVRVCF